MSTRVKPKPMKSGRATPSYRGAPTVKRKPSKSVGGNPFSTYSSLMVVADKGPFDFMKAAFRLFR